MVFLFKKCYYILRIGVNLMLNNKGFAVTTILYTLLIAFLMFLGAALAQFSSSSNIIGKANDDLINGTKLEAKQVKMKDVSPWYNTNTIVKINSRYGTMYFPRDFYEYNNGTGIVGTEKEAGDYTDLNGINYKGSLYKNLLVTCYNGTNYETCSNKNITNNGGLATVAFKQQPKTIQKLSYVNKKANVVPIKLDSGAQDIINELQAAADDIIDSGYLDEGSSIRTFIDERLKATKETKDLSNLDETFTDSYNSNIEIEVKYDNIRKYLTDSIYNYMVEKGIDSFANFDSYIIKLNYYAPDYGDISYNIIDLFYLIRNGSKTDTGGFLGQNYVNYFVINSNGLDADTGESVLIALAAAAGLLAVDNVDVPDISKYALTYLINRVLYDNDNIEDADLTLEEDTPPAPEYLEKFLRIIDTINGEFVELNLYNLYT